MLRRCAYLELVQYFSLTIRIPFHLLGLLGSRHEGDNDKFLVLVTAKTFTRTKAVKVRQAFVHKLLS